MTSLQFAPFSSEIELPFYTALFNSKLDHDKLDDSVRAVMGVYEPRANAAPEESTRMQIHGSALTGSTSVNAAQFRAEGTIKNVNTVEDFKQADKAAMLQTAGRQVSLGPPSSRYPAP